MTASLLRRGLALVALAPLAALAACASPAVGVGSVRFAVSASTTTAAASTDAVPAVHVVRSRVLGRHVNLQEPIVMNADGDGYVAVTFARRQHTALTLAMDPATLASHSETSVEHAPHARPATPSFLSGDPAHIAVAGGGSLACWNDAASNRVLVQVFGADGTWRGSPIVVSPEGVDAFGAPRIASTDGRRFVVSFFTNDEDGFGLVATSLEMQH